MTRTAWFNCFAGTAGDMTMAALVDAGADPVEVIRIVAGLDLDGVALTFERTQRAGVGATLALVAVLDHHDHHDHHDHGGHRDGHQGGHAHRPWRDVRELISAADLPERVRMRALAVYGALAQVEADIHEMAADDVELHEVGALDAIVDVVGTCAALEVLGVDRIVCGPISVGHGTIRAAHGTMPNPAPATAALLARVGAPTRGLDDPLELATPTGAALMTVLAAEFGPMPAMDVAAVGYGAGTKDVAGRANVVQVVIGDTAEADTGTGAGEPVVLLEANVDDATGEVVAHTISRLLDAGAFDAWATPIVMKKGRPAVTLHALGAPTRADELRRVLVRESGTLGVRGMSLQRWPQTRDEVTVDLDGLPVRVKRSAHRWKAEHDDAAAVAARTGVPLREVLARAEDAARRTPS